MYPYNHESGKVEYDPVSYINIFCEELVEAPRRGHQEGSENLGRMLEVT